MDASGRWQLADDQKIIISNLEVWNLKWGDDKTPSKRIKDNWIYLFKDSSIRFLTGEATSQRRLNAELSTEAFKLASEALKRGFQ